MYKPHEEFRYVKIVSLSCQDERIKRFQKAESLNLILGLRWTTLAVDFVHFRPGHAPYKSQHIAKMTRICSFFAVVACLTLQYKFCFVHIDYTLKVHWARLLPLPQCEQNLGYKYLGPDRPGQPRLDSGSLPAGWFPLPDVDRGLLGCHPLVPPLSVVVDLRAALGHVGFVHVTCVLSWAIES